MAKTARKPPKKKQASRRPSRPVAGTVSPTFSAHYHPRFETYEHIRDVQGLLALCVSEVTRRLLRHDASKLKEPEAIAFEAMTPLLHGSTYGAADYEQNRKSKILEPALRHHYQNNSHHPEFHTRGIADMSLFDILEMICDWYASSRRHANGDIWKSIRLNQERFGYSDELRSILTTTVMELLSLRDKEKAHT